MRRGPAAVGRRVAVSVLALAGAAVAVPSMAQTPATAAGGRPDALERLQTELDALLRSGVSRRYGLAWAAVPEPEFRGGGPSAAGGGAVGGGGAGRNAPVVSYLPGHTPAAGLLLHLTAQLLDRPDQPETVREQGRRYREAAVQVARGIAAAMDDNGRVPSSATFATTGLSARESYGLVPPRAASTASLGFLLTLERDVPGDPRLSTAVTRLSSWLVRQPLRPGVFPVAGDLPGTRLQKRIVRLDLPDTRDGVLALLLMGLTAEPLASPPPSPASPSPAPPPPALSPPTPVPSPPAPVPSAPASAGGTDSASPTSPPARPPARFTESRLAAERVVQHLLRLRQSEIDRPSRHLWFPAFEMDGAVITRLPELPPTGHLLASRYALQTLLAYHLATGSPELLDIARLTAQALEARRGPDGLFPLVDDPQRRFRPPTPGDAAGTPDALTPVWPRGDWGISPTLRTVADLRTLGHRNFLVVTERALPLPLAFAALLAGLTDELPTAEWPLTRAQIDVFLSARPDLLSLATAVEPVELEQRVRRLWVLYLLARWQQQLP